MRNTRIAKSITDRDSEAIKIYLKEITRIPLLSKEEEQEIAAKAFTGNKAAQDKLVQSNLRFVVSVAKQYHTQTMELQDVIAEGNLGLIKAASQFDPSKGVRFLSYAVHKIRQAINIAILNKDKLVRIPVNRNADLYKIMKAINKYELEYGMAPSVEELSEITGMSEEDIDRVIGLGTRHESIDAPFAGNQDGFCITDRLSDDSHEGMGEGIDKDSLSLSMQKSLSVLTEREKKIICMTFGIGCKEHTLDEIAEFIGKSRERTRQIREFAQIKIQRNKKAREFLKEYIG